MNKNLLVLLTLILIVSSYQFSEVYSQVYENGSKLYYEKNGTRVSDELQSAITQCMSLDTPHKIILKDLNQVVYVDLDEPCMAASAYFVTNGWQLEDLVVDNNLLKTITLVPDNSTT
jgi:hypothetical protein